MYERSFVTTLSDRLRESRRFIQVVIGPRQTGKSTGVSQALGKLSAPLSNMPLTAHVTGALQS